MVWAAWWGAQVWVAAVTGHHHIWNSVPAEAKSAGLPASLRQDRGTLTALQGRVCTGSAGPCLSGCAGQGEFTECGGHTFPLLGGSQRR